MQLVLKTNPDKLKQIREITSRKELQTTPTKTKKQKSNQYNNCCIIEKKEQIKDSIVQTSNALQSRFSTYNSKYGSKFFVENSGDSINKQLLVANIVVGMIYAGHSIAVANPAFLIPMVANAAAIKLIKLETDLINSVKQPQLVTDLMSYLKAINYNGVESIERLLSQREKIEEKIKAHKEINIGTFSSLGLKNLLDDYNVKLVELEKSKDIINDEILAPVLPILNKYKNVDVEKCLLYIETLNKSAVFKTCLFGGGGLFISLYALIDLINMVDAHTVTNTDCICNGIIELLSVVCPIQFLGMIKFNLLKRMNTVSSCLKTYKDRLGAIKNSASVKTLKNQKSIE
jgi:hypothetical protein